MLFPRLSLLSSAIALAFSPALLADDNSATAENLEVIVVSGNRTEQPLKDVAGSIAVQAAEELELQQVTDFSQLFRYDPSIQVTGSVGGAQNFLVRGMGGNRVLLIKDGMRVNEGYGANGLNDIIGRGFLDTATLKQVEVAKGANSSLYGSDALAGIVVFTTKDPVDYLKDGADFGGSFTAGYADLSSQYHGGVTLAQRINNNFSHMLSGTLRRGEEQQNHASSLEPFDIDSDSVLYKAVYQLNSTDKLSFSADFYQQDTAGERANGLLAYF
ncbi:TonB-dependent receptor plug domain-containing protein, partial [Alishewanella longhuensis]